MRKITFVMTEMNERLAQFMRSEQLTAAKLAEIVQVQPSSISHLLSGRNKPNFEFVSRMLRMFPELNPDWIINGIGSMYRRKQTEYSTMEPNSVIAPQIEPNLFENKPKTEINQSVPFDPFLVTNVTTPDSVSPQNSVLETSFEEARGVTEPVSVAPSEKVSTAPTDASVSATGSLVGVRQVVVLFDDQTCTVYQHR